MATGRMLRKSVSLCKQCRSISMFSNWLFTWLIPHSDDWGRMVADPELIQAQVFPLFRQVRLLPTTAEETALTPELISEGLLELASVGLIILYGTAEEQYLAFPTFEKHQSGLHKRTNSQLPAPPGTSRKVAESITKNNLSSNWESPGTSRKFPPNGTEHEHEHEQNRTPPTPSQSANPKAEGSCPEGKGAAVSSNSVEGKGPEGKPNGTTVFAAKLAEIKAKPPDESDNNGGESETTPMPRTIGEITDKMRMDAHV